MAVDAPLKKRKHYEVDASSPAIASEANLCKAAVPSRSAAAAREGEEERVRRRRNREEIGAFYKMYRRIKFCLDRKHGRTLAFSGDLRDAYFSILNLSTGCTSIRRIAAEFIPRYAIYCPSALELAFTAIKQIFEYSTAAILHDRDSDGIAFKTAETCLSGMVDLSSAAEAAISEFPDLEHMCMTVGQKVSSYLLHELNGMELAAAKPDVNSTSAGAGGSKKDKIKTLIPLHLTRLFCCHPKHVFGACFNLLKDDHQNLRKVGLHFLEQIMKKSIESSQISTVDDQAPSSNPESDKNVTESLSNLSDMKETHSENDEHVGHQVDDSNLSLVVKVLHSNPPLERWLVAECRKFCRCASVDSLNESLPILTALFKSMKSFIADDPNLFFIEDDETIAIEDNLQKDEDICTMEGDQQYISEKCTKLQNVDSETKISPTSNSNGMAADVLDAKGENNLEGLGNSCETCELSTDMTAKSNSGIIFALNNEGLTEEKGHRMKNKDGMEIACITVEDSQHSQTFDKAVERPPELRGSGNETICEDEHVFDAGNYVCARNRDVMGSTVHTLPIVLSPRLVSTPKAQKSSSSQGQVAWYSDGDPSALDVFAASKQLWLGSLGPAANEILVRREFEKFGPVESFSLFPFQDFGLIEYMNITDAVKAREVLQGAMQWGSPLKIKFLDVGLGSRGTIGGVAVGGSCHVYIGRVCNQSAKEELVNDMICAGLKGPLSVCTLVSASALLLEFAAPEEAAAAMLHIRQRRRENQLHFLPSKSHDNGSYSVDGTNLNRHLWVGHIDPLVSEQDLVSAFLQFGEITGWRFVRQNSLCCLIDFHSPESAAFAKAQLNGKKFGSQSIQVEYNHLSPNSQPSSNSSPSIVHALSRNGSNNWLTASPQVNFQSGAISKQNLSSPSAVSIASSRARTSRREVERVPTNTLWFGLSACQGKSFPDDTELKAILNSAAQGIGFVTKMKSACTTTGSCKFVEFDCVEAAATALQNSTRLLDSSIVIEFSNSAISLQQSDFPHNHNAFFQLSIDDNMREDKIFIRGIDRDKEFQSPTLTRHDGSKILGAHNSLGVALGCSGDTVFTEGGMHRAGKSYHMERSELLDDRSRVEAVMERMNSLSSFRSPKTCALNSVVETPDISQGSGQILSNSQTLLERHPPAIGSLNSVLRQSVTQHAVPLVSHQACIHQDRLPSCGSWTGLAASYGVDQSSPVPYSVPNNCFPSACNTATPLQSSVASIIAEFSGSTQAYEQPAAPPPPLANAPALSVSPSPPVILRSSFVAQPLTVQPPSQPPPMESQINLMTGIRDINRPLMEIQQWRGPLCKSGFQYCEVLAYSEESAVCQYETIREPAQWPKKLDVTKRADFRSVKFSFHNTPTTQRQVCRLVGCSGSENKEGYQQFETYLRQRDRAGVVMIPATGNLWARILFILPWSKEACELMSIPDKPTDCFIGLLLPLETPFN